MNINIVTKGINFTNAIDNTNQLIIDNTGVFIKEIYRDNRIDTRDTGFKNLILNTVDDGGHRAKKFKDEFIEDDFEFF